MTSSAAQAEGPGCHLPTPEVSGLSKDGDILLGGIFPLHDDVTFQEPTFTTQPAPLTCQRFQLQNYQSLQAMVFAIEEISRSSDLLPNITLGFRIYDSCRILQRSLEGTLWILAGQAEPLPNFSCQRTLPIMGIIGDASSSCSIVMARVLGLYRLPQISFVSTSPLLSDRKQFPSFFRTIPNDDFQSRGLARLLIHFGWTWVGLLVEDNDYGQHGGQILKQELERLGACVAFFENIILSQANRNAFHIIQVIKNSTATAIVIFATDAGLLPLVDEMVRYGVNGKVFIATEGWSISSTLAKDMYSDVLIGTIGLTIYNGPVPGFEAHLNSVHHSRSAENGFLPIFWEEAFGCKWRDPNNITSTWDNTTEWCTGEEKLENVHIDYNNVYDTQIAYNVYTAVQAIAWALHDLNSHRPDEEQFFNGTSVDIQEIKPWQITQYIKKVNFKNKVGEEVFFNQNGEVPALYDIVNWQRSTERGISAVAVGRFSLQNYQWLQAMVFAIEEISRSSDLLPNITLGFRIYDSCRILQRSLEGTLWILAGQAEPLPNFSCQRTLPIMGIIGDASSSCSIAMARVLGLYRLPQISFVSTSPLLSDRKQFPSFFRTIPNDDFQSRGLARLLIHFGWTWVGLLVEDNDYGQHGGQILKQELERLGACVAFFETIILSKANRNAFHIIQVIKNSTATAIVIFATDAGLLPLVDEMVRYGVNGKVFIATEGWSISSTLAKDMYSEVLIGTIGLTIYDGPVPGFEAHLNSVHHSRSAKNGFLPMFWEEAFGCKWRGPDNITSTWDNTTEWCTGDEKLENVHIDYNKVYDTQIAYNVYTAVQAIAWALHDLNSHRPEEEQFFNGTSVNIQEIKPWKITQYIKKVHFKNKVGEEVFFNQNGEVPAQYDIVNWQRSTEGGIRPVAVGRFSDLLEMPMGSVAKSETGPMRHEG
ncbi:hypothetical protein NDU88_000636 [Pleurodeles waltl]|uniref:Receptor ligand binding region domain-containing protein n=1 Tax=Pleurodeles waltl TaxID=8319 RepID=A0AAV7KTZ1_PLEWA|nr:hypothetical protein NDU88_000636 [Pleurodeles waltl]